MLDFNLTPEQREVRKQARAFALNAPLKKSGPGRDASLPGRTGPSPLNVGPIFTANAGTY